MFDGTFQFVKAVELLAVNFILQIAPQEEVKGVRSGLRAGHSIVPRLPIRLLVNLSLRALRTTFA